MKRIFTRWQLSALALIVITAASCKQEQLGDVLSKESYAAVSISLPTKLDIGTGSTFTVNAGDVVVPVTVSFSSATTRSFSLNLSTNVDTVASLVAAGTLPAGTIAFTSATAAVPQVVSVPIGVTSFTANLSVSRSFIELNYGKNIAVVVKASNPDKGNKFVAGKNTAVINLKTGEVLAPGSVHEIQLGTTSPVVKFPSGATSTVNTVDISKTTYTVGSESITFNIPIRIQGDLGTIFSVDGVVSPDSVTKYITAGTVANGKADLVNTVLYDRAKISVINPTISFPDNSPVAVFSFSTKINTLLAVQPAATVPTAKPVALAFTFQNPSKFRVATSNTVYCIIDVNAFRPYYGTPFLIKGAIGAVSDPIFGAYYDLGGQSVAWNDNTTKDGDGAWRAPDYVDVVGDYTPRSVIGWTANNEWVSFSVFVEQDGNYGIETYMGASNLNGRWSIWVDNVNISGQQATTRTTGGNNGNQQPFPLIIGGVNPATVPLKAGYHILKLNMDVASYDFRGFVFTRKS